MSKISDVTGVILAGGKSSRFGENKAFALLNGTPLIEQVLEVMQHTFEKVILVTNTPADFAHLKVLVLTDSIPYQGPLGGIMTALEYATNDGIFAVACDMPLLNPLVIRHIVEKRKNHLAAVAKHDGRPQYLMAFYSKKLIPTIAPLLEQERLSLTHLCGLLSDIVWVPVEGTSWTNVNTRDDLRFVAEQNARGVE